MSMPEPSIQIQVPASSTPRCYTVALEQLERATAGLEAPDPEPHPVDVTPAVMREQRDWARKQCQIMLDREAGHLARIGEQNLEAMRLRAELVASEALRIQAEANLRVTRGAIAQMGIEMAEIRVTAQALADLATQGPLDPPKETL